MAEETVPTQQPRHQKPQRQENRQRFMLRQIMNTLFILGVLALIVAYFVKPGIQSDFAYMACAMFVVLVKIAEMIIRYLPK